MQILLKRKSPRAALLGEGDLIFGRVRQFFPDMISGVISGKASTVSLNQAGESGERYEPPSHSVSGVEPPNDIFGL